MTTNALNGTNEPKIQIKSTMATPRISTQIDNAVEVPKIVRASLERIKKRIIANMSANRRNASGRSVDSLYIETTRVGGTLHGLRSFVAMETGRKGGKIPKGFADIILQWIKDKGISFYSTHPGSPDTQMKSAAYLISRHIANKGTALNLITSQDIYSKAVETEYQILQSQILASFGSQVRYINEKYAKEE